MTIIRFAVFLLLIIVPVLLAWLRGDQVIDYLSRRQRQRRMHRRNRATRALPVREVAINSLLAAEHRRDRAEDRISEALAQFRQVTENGRALVTRQPAVATLEEIEQIVLSRESQFGEFLDIAWMQSESIEALTEEVALLREAAELNRPQAVETRTTAAEQLLANLERAVQKRRQIDRKLTRIGPRTPPSGKTPGFDVTM